MRTVAVLAILMLALSGCSKEAGPEPTQDAPDSDDGTPAADPEAPPADDDHDGVPNEEEAPPAEVEAGGGGYLQVTFEVDNATGEPGLEVWFNVTPSSFYKNGTRSDVVASWTVSFTNETLGLLTTGTGARSFNHTFPDEGAFVLVLNATAPEYGYATANLTIIVGTVEIAPPGPGEGVERPHRCTPASNSLQISNGNAYFRCGLWTATELAVLVDADVPSGCNISHNVGEVYEAGTEFIGRCGPTQWAQPPEVGITVRTWT